jgi:glycosyltransferase involved in cell wall biosynthesis
MTVMGKCAPLILHDYFLAPDGGGKVAIALARNFEADLVCADLNRDAYGPGELVPEPSVLSRAPWPLTLKQALGYWWAFSHLPPIEVPWAVFSGMYALLAAHAVHGKRIYYCHTPPRNLYDLRQRLAQRTPAHIRPARTLLLNRYRAEYEASVDAMDIIVANSRTVQQRIRQYLGRDSLVVHPPCEIERFSWAGQEDYYLSVARLEPAKRVGMIIRAFKRMPDKKLVVASDGSLQTEFKAMAADCANIRFTGAITDQKMADLIGRCIACVYVPESEDFGISPIEAMAAGKPVISVREGGTGETILHERTGLLLDPCFDEEALIEAVRFLSPRQAATMREECRRRASGYNAPKFIEKMNAVLHEM